MPPINHVIVTNNYQFKITCFEMCCRLSNNNNATPVSWNGACWQPSATAVTSSFVSWSATDSNLTSTRCRTDHIPSQSDSSSPANTNKHIDNLPRWQPASSISRADQPPVIASSCHHQLRSHHQRPQPTWSPIGHVIAVGHRRSRRAKLSISTTVNVVP